MGVYLEPPKEFLFTTRTQRHIDKSYGFRLKNARYWADILNAIDPGHIDKFNKG